MDIAKMNADELYRRVLVIQSELQITTDKRVAGVLLATLDELKKALENTGNSELIGKAQEVVYKKNDTKIPAYKGNTVVKTIITIAAVIAIFVGIGFASDRIYKNHMAEMQAKYEHALQLEEQQSFAEAAQIFEELKEYNDSADHKIADEFFDEYVNSNKLIVSSPFSGGIKDVSIAHHEDSNIVDTIVILSPGEEKLSQFKPETLLKWNSVYSSYMQIAKNYEAAVNGAVPMKPQTKLAYYLEDDSHLLMEFEGGEIKYSAIDIDKEKDIVLDNIYAEISAYVDEENYDSAIAVREAIWPEDYEYSEDMKSDESSMEDFYAWDYKDIQDYYYYARAMKLYKSANTLPLMNEVIGELNCVRDGFKEKKEICDIIQGYEDQLLGTFTHVYKTFGSAGDHRYYVSVGLNGVKFGFGQYSPNKINKWSESYVNFYSEEGFVIEDGKISTIVFDNKLGKVEITPEKGGMRVRDLTDYTSRNHWDLNGSTGFYTKFEE